jgi:hypothetical protein
MEVKMKKFPTIAVALGLLLSVTAGAQNNRIPEAMKKIEPLPRELEIQLALSALPAHLREHATVYVLNPGKGFEVARKARMDSTPWWRGPVMMRSGGRGP